MSVTLVSLASRQIWPHVLAVAHLKPQKLILLHSIDEAESKKPAERLKAYFEHSGGPETTLERIPSDNYYLIQERLSIIASQHQISPNSGIVHFTGGNKLMATAAHEWAKMSSFESCYLERGNILYRFTPDHPRPTIITEKIDPKLLCSADPIQLLCAQLGESTLQHPGERLTLNEGGKLFGTEQLAQKLKMKDIHSGFSFRSLVNVENEIRGQSAVGDNLEYAAAVVILKHGVPEVRRSVKFKSTPDANVTESEIDVVFHWNGKLWMADCKAKSSGATKLRKLEKAIKDQRCNFALLKPYFDKLKGQLADTEARLIKEDLQQISEMGGLLGSAFAIRMQGLRDDVMRFARSRRPKVEVVHVAEMSARIPQILA